MTLEGDTILITGAAGFIGYNFTEYITKKYPKTKFIGLDKISYCSTKSIFNLKRSNFTFVQCNLLNLDHLEEVFEKGIDIVIHFAAYTHVDLSFGNSLKFTKNNILGTHNLVECARKYPVKRFIHVSTDEVYGSKDTISTETSLLEPTNPYSATKAGAEHIVSSYYHSFKVPVIITRGNNVYGPHQYPDKLIPLFILNLHNEKECNIHGSGDQLRSFLHVNDCIKAFETILLKGKISEIYNISSKDEFSVNEIYDMLCNKLKIKGTSKNVKDRHFNDHRYQIDSSKLESLGWKQEIFMDEGLTDTIKWYIDNSHLY